MVVSVYRKLHRRNAAGVRDFVSLAAASGYVPLILTSSCVFLREDLRPLY